MKKLIFFLSAIVLTLSCTTKFEKYAEQESLKKAHWISDGRLTPENDSLFYSDRPAPIFRKEFSVDENLISVKLVITASGYYKATINGERIGLNKLDPAWTNFSKRIYYSEYDITEQVKTGENCLGVVLGNGFYNPLPLKMWGSRNLREVLPVGNPAFIASCILKYKNGKTAEIVSDESWRFHPGPVLKNNVYLGEVYDANLEFEEWDNPGFDAGLWKNTLKVDGPGGRLQKRFFPPVQVTQKITPVKIYSPNEGIYIADMGTNFTGQYKIKLSGEKGDKIVFRFGERIYDDGTLNPMTTVCGQIKRAGMGGPGAPDIAWQNDSYIFNNKKEVWYEPEFTFHTFRYMEISGLRYPPQISDIEGLALNSAINQINSFSCSSDLLNDIQKATQRTFLSNLISVQSDCAAREKFGYGGDLNATSEAFICNFDMHDFYRKTIYDWVDAMNDSVFVDTAPYVGIKYCGISWESAFLTTQYKLYLYYKDTQIIKELYELDKIWMEKVARLHPNGIVESGLSDHESLKPVPVELTGTCHYLECANIMKQFAKIMGDTQFEDKYQNLANELRELIKRKFWDNPVEQNINKQTLFSTLLYHEIIPDKDMEACSDSLLLAVKNGPEGHFNTGIFGTKYILEALSKSGNPNSVFDVVNSTEYPGWGFMMDRGATTIWETWKESDNTYSNCHPMFGSVTEWFYRCLGGIQPDNDYPGFERFAISPFVPNNLEFVNAKYESPFGEIISSWKKGEASDITFDLKIPKESRAVFRLIANELVNAEIRNVETNHTIFIDQIKNNTKDILLENGHYLIHGRLKK